MSCMSVHDIPFHAAEKHIRHVAHVEKPLPPHFLAHRPMEMVYLTSWAPFESIHHLHLWGLLRPSVQYLRPCPPLREAARSDRVELNHTTSLGLLLCCAL